MTSRAFDIVPVASGSTPHSYSLRFEVVPERAEPILRHEKGYFMGNAGVRIYLRRAEIMQRVPDLSPGRPYAVRATMTYVLPVSNVESDARVALPRGSAGSPGAKRR